MDLSFSKSTILRLGLPDNLFTETYFLVKCFSTTIISTARSCLWLTKRIRCMFTCSKTLKMPKKMMTMMIKTEMIHLKYRIEITKNQRSWGIRTRSSCRLISWQEESFNLRAAINISKKAKKFKYLKSKDSFAWQILS